MVTKDQIKEKLYCDERYAALVLDAICCKYAIVKNGGMANKSAVEDFLILRHSVDRCEAHEIMNNIEYHMLDSDLYRRSFGEVPSASLADYPELKNVKIKWYKK